MSDPSLSIDALLKQRVTVLYRMIASADCFHFDDTPLITSWAEVMPEEHVEHAGGHEAALRATWSDDDRQTFEQIITVDMLAKCLEQMDLRGDERLIFNDPSGDEVELSPYTLTPLAIAQMLETGMEVERGQMPRIKP